jgi:hypothetical protein
MNASAFSKLTGTMTFRTYAHNGVTNMRKLAIISIAALSIAGSAHALDNSQSEGSYYGGGYDARSGLENSKGAASYYYGGGNQQAPSPSAPWPSGGPTHSDPACGGVCD